MPDVKKVDGTDDLDFIILKPVTDEDDYLEKCFKCEKFFFISELNQHNW